MKINEIITENIDADHGDRDQIPDSHIAATPGMKIHPGLDNSSPYAQWRFAANFLPGSPNFDHEPSKEGPIGQKLITVAYTKADEDIIDAAEKKFGARSHRISPNGSSEDTTVQRNSPVQPKGPITLKRK
jgi:hypothetical protein